MYSCTLPEIKLWRKQSKRMQKQISRFSTPVTFHSTSLIWSKYDDRDRYFLSNVGYENPDARKVEFLKD